MNKKIAWEKFEVPEDEAQPVINSPDEDGGFDDDEEIDEELLNMKEMGFELLSINTKIKTPFGTYDIKDPFNPYNMFECWIGYTNFPITESCFNILNNEVDGIGALKIITKYRFFIGVEKLFSFTDVRSQIQSLLCEPSLAVDKESEIINLLRTKTRWAIYLSDTGDITSISEFDPNYETTLNSLKSKKGGNLITSEIK